MAEYVYRPVVAVAKGLFGALRLRIDIQGVENIPASGGAVVLINHISYLDFALAGLPFWQAGRRPVRYMAKKAVFDHRVAGPLMRGMHHIPVDRQAGAASLREALTALRAGELVGVFPEATINPSYCLASFKSGAARMATHTKVPVIPVILWGSQRTLTKGHPFRPREAVGTPITITVGTPVPPSELADRRAGTDVLHKVMVDLLDTAQRGYPRPAPGQPDWWLPAHLGGSAPPPLAADADEV
ncbi:1-acyl-sn-glycerol-3-phosphate acyltransferase [Frankia canadensis]|uniref:1-acyl-sn-glycerol-3-phosphate acyltransferase n=1 Tax=Frankia canadensis TaxID=1836972 RepID=A0A2I2KMJ0_9ACTN|nr:lysophospholipid acyltransferase family protein [Frankia canadensis]SNQ46885.1 1-acyl-sn-glycerol-3-phosphate acyltransferase [Frankia canadensis]SOU54175.1 1-acyl-sn-glycerol-3-phosphate acyltransferase [Frankia canadensis]